MYDFTNYEELEEALAKLERGELEDGAFYGQVLGLIHAIYELPGEDYTDEECLGLMTRALASYNKILDSGAYR